MNPARTALALAGITDEGLFECLATAILRAANPRFDSLAHTGVNAAGKAIRSPLDGICFVPDADPPHMIAVHHTITARGDLEKKWLHDPAKVKPRNGSRPTAPPGDLIKTAELAAEERIRTPNLRVTLVLTTNEEPGEALVRSVEAAGRERRLEIDLWGRSRLTHFLDNQPTGHWLRRDFLGIEQEQLSRELLRELCIKSLEVHSPPDNPAAWVPRALDATLNASHHRNLTFLVAGSGLGKSVACYRRLKAYVESGGFGIFLPHEVVDSAITIDQAVTSALRQLHPSLAAIGVSAISLCSPEQPLLLVVEDINRSGQTTRLLARIAGWTPASTGKKTSGLSSWRLVCPLWPEIIASLGDQARKRIDPLIVVAGTFTASEGRDAVLARAQLEGRELSQLSATDTASALGHDPLFIALHDQETAPNPHQVIGQFVEGCLSRTAAEGRDHPAADYRSALRLLAGGMLTRRQIEVGWREISRWSALQGEPLHLLSRLAHQGELLRFAGWSDDQRLLFRHDRVRDWLLADAAAELDHRDLLTNDLISDPFFAEVMGAALVWGRPGPTFLSRIATLNPLGLVHALRLFGEASGLEKQAVLQAIDHWLDEPATHEKSNQHLRWEALDMLSETDSPEVPRIVRKFRDKTSSGQLARLRNCDISGGIELGTGLIPGIRYPLRDAQIEHAKLHHGRTLVALLNEHLCRPDLSASERVGALRLTIHIGNPSLASAIETCWTGDGARCHHLADYLWSFSECCGDDPDRYLGPVCDAWAALPDKSEKEHSLSPRSALLAFEFRWALEKTPPVAAIHYFIRRGAQDELSGPITEMLSHIDDPEALSFVAEQSAAIARQLEGTDSIFLFPMILGTQWKRAQEERGRGMSKASRDRLLTLWNDEANDKHLRAQAFALWAATQASDDVDILRSATLSNDIADFILQARLRRRDQQAIPAMIEKLAGDDRGRWWQYGRYIWSAELNDTLDVFLDSRRTLVTGIWNEYHESDWITHELIRQLPKAEAERLLLKHWDHLRLTHLFVQTALYVSTPALLKLAGAAINDCPEPNKLMEHLGYSFGFHMKGHPGLTDEAQVRAIGPYLHLLTRNDLLALWDTCNDRGWFAIRRELLDGWLQPVLLRNKSDHDQAATELDKMIGETGQHKIRYWIDNFLKRDVSWKTILSTMIAWLDQRHSLEALQIVTAAIMYRGTREDLEVLRTFEGMPGPAARELIADTAFAVRRRSLR
ncbi:hypothetical protein [uncultured Thiodictyon sp.]|uniref:hypothetical protein n=1 Tax=uncultured Thiodictyon sp. TaxID=1846217 RepID=UPI0025EB3E9C|nr:hypothetical protein [uncultured Thiodictyon sp.]